MQRSRRRVRSLTKIAKRHQNIPWWPMRPTEVMMTSSNENIFRVTGPLCGEFTGDRWIPPHKGQWRGALMFSLICVFINGCVNNREAGDLRRYRAHYDVTLMCFRSLLGNESLSFLELEWREAFPLLLISTGGECANSMTGVWWRHEMKTLPRYWPSVRGIHRSPVNSPHKGQWRGALMFSLICARTNGWANHRHAGDLRRHLIHNDVTVMSGYTSTFLQYRTTNSTSHCFKFTTAALNILRPIQKEWPPFCRRQFQVSFPGLILWIFNEISLKYVPYGPIVHMTALVQIMARRWTSDKPLFEPTLLYCTDAFMPHMASIS